MDEFNQAILLNMNPESLVSYVGGKQNAAIFSWCRVENGNKLLITNTADKGS